MMTCVPLGLCRLVNSERVYLNSKPGEMNKSVLCAVTGLGEARLSSTHEPLVPMATMLRLFCIASRRTFEPVSPRVYSSKFIL